MVLKRAACVSGAAGLLMAATVWAQGNSSSQIPTAANMAALAGGGYVGRFGLIDAGRYLPPPPAAGSAAEAADIAALAAARTRIGDATWTRAIDELNPRSPASVGRMMCALGAQLTPATAPALFRLLERSGRDLSAASEASKAAFNRPRPFEGKPDAVTCYPPDVLAKGLGSSYPSGHSGIGWLWGMILSQVAPDRAAEALVYGRGYGEHRIACMVHYPTDVDSGRLLGSVLYAQMSAIPAFRADLDAAKAEVAAAKAAGAKPAGCD